MPYKYGEHGGTGVDRGPEAVEPVVATRPLVPSSVRAPGTGVGRRSAPGGGKPAPVGTPRPGPRQPAAAIVKAGFRWEEPPVASGRGRDATLVELIVAELMTIPGQWARVKTGQKNRPEGKAFRSRGCETRTRKDPGAETFGLWARYIGTKGSKS